MPASGATRNLSSRIQAPGASPGTWGIKATPLSAPPGVCPTFRCGRARAYTTSQSPGSRRGLLWAAHSAMGGTSRGKQDCDPDLRLASGATRNLSSRIQAPGASPGTWGIKATPLSAPPGVCPTFRCGRARAYTTSQSPGSRRGLLWAAHSAMGGTSRGKQDCDPDLRLASGATRNLSSRIQAPGASPGTWGIKAAPLSTPPGVRPTFRCGRAGSYATSQSPGSRRRLLWAAHPAMGGTSRGTHAPPAGFEPLIRVVIDHYRSS